MQLTFKSAEKRINDTLVFPSFDLTIHPGQVTAMYSNVNIREQLIQLFLGKTALSQGHILIEEQNMKFPSPQIGFLFLNPGLYERLTVQEMLLFVKKLYHSPHTIHTVIQALGLEQIKSTKINKLSYSEKKRTQFSCLFLQDPSIFVLEEPDQNLDIESRQIFLSIYTKLRHAGKSTLILTGNLESAITAADRVFALDSNGLSPIPVEENHLVKAGRTEEKKHQLDIEQIELKKIPTKVNDKIVLFNPTEIDYIESSNGRSYLHIKGESFPSDFTLQELETRLLPFGFFRCHRSYIVNLQKVREVITWTRNSYSLVLEDATKSTIPLSKSKMTQLREMMGLK
ncbi:LytTR family transcriptional regulator DNA-binding domain-containing protein [Siminovitchia sediminis]|uniref:LytTR family transcriptional regulator DNA-binding domain-containing protein n=1 Tax=Siminovitchia sediminis TaxID=1274353 RepID=A0ABW4KM65_9BACI